jgi:hypothetical protein
MWIPKIKIDELSFDDEFKIIGCPSVSGIQLSFLYYLIHNIVWEDNYVCLMLFKNDYDIIQMKDKIDIELKKYKLETLFTDNCYTINNSKLYIVNYKKLLNLSIKNINLTYIHEMDEDLGILNSLSILRSLSKSLHISTLDFDGSIFYDEYNDVVKTIIYSSQSNANILKFNSSNHVYHIDYVRKIKGIFNNKL